MFCAAIKNLFCDNMQNNLVCNGKVGKERPWASSMFDWGTWSRCLFRRNMYCYDRLIFHFSPNVACSLLQKSVSDSQYSLIKWRQNFHPKPSCKFLDRTSTSESSKSFAIRETQHSSHRIYRSLNIKSDSVFLHLTRLHLDHYPECWQILVLRACGLKYSQTSVLE